MTLIVSSKKRNYEWKKIAEKGIDIDHFIIVQKLYMERRSYATFKKHWPDKKLVVTSPQFDLEDYATDEIPLEKVINIMVGDLQRIKLYPARGFQIVRTFLRKCGTLASD